MVIMYESTTQKDEWIRETGNVWRGFILDSTWKTAQFAIVNFLKKKLSILTSKIIL